MARRRPCCGQPVQFIFVWLFCHMAMPANAARHLRALALAVAGARLRRYPGQTLSAFAARRRRARRMQGVVKDTDRFFLPKRVDRAAGVVEVCRRLHLELWSPPICRRVVSCPCETNMIAPVVERAPRMLLLIGEDQQGLPMEVIVVERRRPRLSDVLRAWLGRVLPISPSSERSGITPAPCWPKSPARARC